MGCSTSRTISAEETLCKKMYDAFTNNDIKSIIDAGSEGATMKVESKNGKVPYAGVFTKGGNDGTGLADFFKGIGKEWKDGVGIQFEPKDFKTDEKETKNDVHIRQLTTSGKVIFGKEQHIWELDIANGKWKTLTVIQDIHDEAYDEKTNQTVQMMKLCWILFGEGKTKDIIEKTSDAENVLDILGDAEEKDRAKVPYAGKWYSKTKDKDGKDLEGRKGMDAAFTAMNENWVKDETFKFEPVGDYNGDDEWNATVEVEINAKVKKTGKTISGKETHACKCKKGDDGVIRTISWTVTKGPHHVAGFTVDDPPAASQNNEQ